MIKDHVCRNKLKRYVFSLKNDHELVKSLLVPNARVLDFGCNDCKFFDHINDIKGLKLVGFDVDKQALEIAKSKGYEVYDSLDKIEGPFDFIVSNEVVEHLKVNTELPEFFKKSKELLSNDGKLIVSTMNINEFYANIDFWHDPTHIRPLTIESVQRLGEESGLKVVEVIKHHMRVSPRKILVNLILGLDLHAGYTIILKNQNNARGIHT